MTTAAGKIVLITGAAGDIGYGLVGAFLRTGAMVIASDIRSADLGQRLKGLDVPGGVIAVEADLADQGSVARLAEAALAVAGKVDVLVNNAAIQHDGDVENCPPEAFERSYAINLRAPYLLSHALVPAMREAGEGAIINIASVHATAPGPRRLAYATTKTALLGMTRSMAVDLGRYGIRVNAISPGATNTSQLQAAWSTRRSAPGGVDVFTHAARQHPLGRLAEVDDIADAAVFLADSRFISGIELRIDGGFLSSLRLLPASDPAEAGSA